MAQEIVERGLAASRHGHPNHGRLSHRDPALDRVLKEYLQEFLLQRLAGGGVVLGFIRLDEHGPRAAIAAGAKSEFMQGRIALKLVPDSFGFAMTRTALDRFA